MNSTPTSLTGRLSFSEPKHADPGLLTDTQVGRSVAGRQTEICILLTCFNRIEKTLLCLRAVYSSAVADNTYLSVVLVDDGSTDGTADTVAAEFPQVKIHRHAGSALYWCRGMNKAVEIAKSSRYDYLLLLNDDTILMPEALAQMLATAQGPQMAGERPVIVVGSTRDQVSLAHTYGGERRISRWRRTAFRLVAPLSIPQQVDTFDGNIVLIPAAAIEVLGNLDPTFEHAMGDIDLGLRARAQNIQVWLAPGFQGFCSVNPVEGTFNDAQLKWVMRWKLMLSRKGLPWRSWLHFTKRHCGMLWPIFFLWPYLRLILRGIGGRS